MRFSLRRSLLAASLCAITPTFAFALPVVYTITVSGLFGTLGGDAFHDQKDTFTATGDTGDIDTYDSYHELLSASAQVAIGSLWTVDITNDTYVWSNVNRTSGVQNIGFFDDNWNDIVFAQATDETSGASLSGDDLGSDVSLSFSTAEIYYNSFPTIETNAGALVFDPGYAPATFVAEVSSPAPLPATAPLLVAGLASLGFARRRRG